MRFILELLVCNSLLRCNNLIMSRVSMIGANLGVANDEPPSEFHITSLHVILSLRSWMLFIVMNESTFMTIHLWALYRTAEAGAFI